MTSQVSSHFLLSFTFLLLLLHHSHGGGGGSRRLLLHAFTFIYAACSLDKFPPNSPYQTNLNQLLTSATTSSVRSLYNPFTVGNDTVPVYGLYQCRGDLKFHDCASCIAGAITQIELLCPYTCGATIQLDGCFLRYDHDNFIGKLDYEIRHEKCGRRIGDNDFVRRRDEVLGNLGRVGATGYGVSTIGEVEGYAQCLGDLVLEDCTTCLREGVAKVTAVCGAAVAGDMFLGKCYVRYWESGYYDSLSSSGTHLCMDECLVVFINAHLFVNSFVSNSDIDNF